MADNEWKIAKRGTKCSHCSVLLDVEKPYFSALVQKNTELERLDYCLTCFESHRPEALYYFWKAAPPENLDAGPVHRRQPLVDIEHVMEFFKRLEGASDPQKIAFRFILALMLSRKKILVFEQRKKDNEGRELQIFREKRGGGSHQVFEPALNDQEIATVSAELGVLLGLTPPKPPQGQPAPGAGEPSPAGAEAPAGEAVEDKMSRSDSQ